MLIVVLLIIWLIHDYKNDKKNPKLIKTYHKAGLSDQDIVIFRQTMQDAKNQIKQWEIAVKEDAALQVIEQVTGGLDSAKKLFQLIVKRPKIALSNNEFLYKHLALLVDSQKVIRVLSEKVAGLYALTVSDDIETIKNEVENG